MADTTLDIIVALKDQLTKPLEGIKSKMSGLGDRLNSAADASKTLALGVTAGAAALGGLGYAAIKAAADAEQTQIAFTTMLGSAEKAGAFTKDLVNFAKTTPFELKGLEDSSKKLLAYGLSQKEILPTLKNLGDIAAGVGTEKLPFLITALGQVRAKTILSGEELKQFTETGVPLIGELAKVTGFSVGQITDRTKDLGITYDQVNQALGNLAGTGGKFNNLMEKQAGSLSGMVSNLADAWDIFLRGQGAPLIEWGKKFVAILIDIVQNQLPKFVDYAGQLVKSLEENKLALILVSGILGGIFLGALYSVVTGFVALVIAAGPFLLAGVVIAGIVAGVLWVVQNWEMLKSRAIEIWNAVASFFTSIWEGIKGVFNLAVAFIVGLVITEFSSMGIDIVAVWNTVSSAISAVWEVIKTGIGTALDWIMNKVNVWGEPIRKAFSSVWQGVKAVTDTGMEMIKDGVKAVLNWIIGKLNTLINAFKSVASKGASVMGLSIPDIPTIPELAEGGIVTRPTLAMVGEGGQPEAVIPLSKARSQGFGGGSVVLNITVNGDVTGEDLIERVGKELTKLVKLSTATV